MNSSKVISGRAIKNIVTKFYYKGNNLCFQILIDIDEAQLFCYKEYTDYSAYKKDYTTIKKIKSGNLSLPLTKKLHSATLA